MLISKYGNGSTKLVEEFENENGIEFDEQYRLFLVNYNGGDTPKTTVRIKGISSDLRCLFGMNAKNDIENHMQLSELKNKHCIPIGEDSYGNYYIIGITGDNKGVVYFSNHEKGFELIGIAASFSEFLAICKSDPINPRSQRSPEEREAELIANGKADNITEGIREMRKQEYEKYKNIVQEIVIINESTGDNDQ